MNIEEKKLESAENAHSPEEIRAFVEEWDKAMEEAIKEIWGSREQMERYLAKL